MAGSLMFMMNAGQDSSLYHCLGGNYKVLTFSLVPTALHSPIPMLNQQKESSLIQLVRWLFLHNPIYV